MKKQEQKVDKEEIGKKKNQGLNEEIEIEKIVLSIGAVGDELDKATRLLNIISKMKAVKTKSKKRIPAFDIRPGLEIGCKVTIRGKKGEKLLKILLEAINNRLKEKQITKNCFSFGIPEYIEIPEIEYQRDIGMMGLNVTVVFKRKGKRVLMKKKKRGRLPKKQHVEKEEIINFMKENFKIEIEGKHKPGEEE